MKQIILRRLVMWLVLIGHVTAMGSCFVFISDFDEALGVALCLLPLTGMALMFIVQFHEENFFGSETDQKIVSFDAATLTLGLSGLLVVAIIAALWGYYRGRIGSIEALQKIVSLIDTGIAIYLAILLKRLFERKPAP